METLHRRKAAEYLQNAIHKNQISNLRFCGTIMAFDIGTEDGTNYFAEIGSKLKEEFLKRDLLIRPLGNTVYLMPPYCITEDQLDNIYKNISEVLTSLTVSI